MLRCVCPGSYDPMTYGHLDVIDRAARLFDEVFVAILVNPVKATMFTAAVRAEMIEESTSHLRNVRVESFSGLLVDYCRSRQIGVVVKGVRVGADVDYELQMAQMNRHLAEVETLFLATNPSHSFISSTLVKDVATNGGDVSTLVPAAVLRRFPPAGRVPAEDGGTSAASA